MNMDVSIIIPVYNVEPYVEACLNSVISQSYIGSMECIIVDDCGTDGSMIIAENILRLYKGPIKFRIIHHDTNYGLSAARNTGLKAAIGKYVYFLDSDDTIEIECIKLMMETARKYPEAELVQGGSKMSTGLELMNLKSKKLLTYTENRKYIVKSLLNVNIMPVSSWNKLVKRSFLIDNSLYFIEGVIHEDIGWCFYLSKYLKRLAICKYNTYNYLVREGSIMSGLKEEKALNSCLKLSDDFINNISDEFKIQQLGYIFRLLQSHYVFAESKKNKQLVKNALCHLRLKMSYIDKFVLSSFLVFPNFLLKKKIIYKAYTYYFVK